MEFSRQEYWSELLFPSPGSLPDQGLNSHLLHGQEHSLPLCHLGCKFFLSQWSQGLERLWQSPFPFQTFQTTALHVREKGKEKLKKYTCMLSCFYLVLLFVTPWTAAHQAPLSMGFSRQEYWSGLSYSFQEISVDEAVNGQLRAGQLVSFRFISSCFLPLLCIKRKYNAQALLSQFRGCSHQPPQWFPSPGRENLSLLPLFPHLFTVKWWDRTPWSYFFWMLSFTPAFSLCYDKPRQCIKKAETSLCWQKPI